MAAILGDAYPDLFAAVGVHSGLPTGSATDVKSAFAAMKTGGGAATSTGQTPPTIVFHGDQDIVVHPVNGEHVVAASAVGARPELLRARSGNGRAYTRCIDRDVSGRAVAEHWLVHGAGHAWSGGSARGSYTDAKGPDATEEMLRFFFEEPDTYRPEQLIPKGRDVAAAITALTSAATTVRALTDWTPESIEGALRALGERLGWSSRDFFMLLRVAVTGRTVTPPLIESISRLGKETVLNRLERAARALAPPV